MIASLDMLVYASSYTTIFTKILFAEEGHFDPWDNGIAAIVRSGSGGSDGNGLERIS